VDISAASPIKVSDVSLGDVVGSGSFGVVYRARVNATGQLIVVKMVNIDLDLSDDLLQVDALLNELQLLQSLHHDRIVRYLGHERIVGKSLYQLGPIPGPDSSDKLLIFCEYMPGGSLASTIKQFGALDEKAIALHTKHILEVSRILNKIR
jgi:serine/threonine protein kinase